MCVESGEALAGLGTPELEWLLVVFAAGGHETLGRMPIDALDVGAVSPQNPLLETSVKVPNADGSIVRARRELCVRRAPAHLTNGLFVSLEHFHIVHVRLPIFDESVMISRNHPRVVVIPNHVTNSGIVSLQNGLEVEGESIPESEFSAGGAGHESASIRRPGETEDRTPNLVSRSADELGRDGVDRVVAEEKRRHQL